MKANYEVHEMSEAECDMPVACQIDLNNLDWKMLDKLAKAKPMDVHRMREGLRNQILSCATVHGLEHLRKWAMGLDAAALDYAVHLGFMESAFWKGVTGRVDEPTSFVEFTGPPKTVDDGNHRA